MNGSLTVRKRTDRRTDWLTFSDISSTGVENCNVLSDYPTSGMKAFDLSDFVSITFWPSRTGTKSSGDIVEMVHFDLFWPPSYPLSEPLSQGRRFAWTWKSAHICTLILSTFPRRRNHIVRIFFEKISKTPFSTRFDPSFTPYLVNQIFAGCAVFDKRSALSPSINM